MWKILEFLSENFLFLVVKFSVYLNRLVFIMRSACISTDLSLRRATCNLVGNFVPRLQHSLYTDLCYRKQQERRRYLQQLTLMSRFRLLYYCQCCWHELQIKSKWTATWKNVPSEIIAQRIRTVWSEPSMSEWNKMYAQADLNLCWAHMSEGTFYDWDSNHSFEMARRNILKKKKICQWMCLGVKVMWL